MLAVCRNPVARTESPDLPSAEAEAGRLAPPPSSAAAQVPAQQDRRAPAASCGPALRLCADKICTSSSSSSVRAASAGPSVALSLRTKARSSCNPRRCCATPCGGKKADGTRLVFMPRALPWDMRVRELPRILLLQQSAHRAKVATTHVLLRRVAIFLSRVASFVTCCAHCSHVNGALRAIRCQKRSSWKTILQHPSQHQVVHLDIRPCQHTCHSAAIV